VQQIVGPMLEAIEHSGRWTVVVAHPGDCSAGHRCLATPASALEHDHVDSLVYRQQAREIAQLTDGADAVLSIDRALPLRSGTPRVLMCNSLSYVTEACAVVAGDWAAVITPTERLAGHVRELTAAPVAAIPYGLPRRTLEVLRSLAEPDWTASEFTALLPHRPDPRKGHRDAIIGLRTDAGSRCRLLISWLDERRYDCFRASLEELVVTSQLEERVSFATWKADADRWSAWRDAHAVIQVGDFEETFGLSLVEAAISGRLAVTASQPATSEILTGSAALVEVSEPRQWASALAAAANSPPPRHRWQRESTDMAAEYATLLDGIAFPR